AGIGASPLEEATILRGCRVLPPTRASTPHTSTRCAPACGAKDKMRRFLLVRLDGLGDALVCVPALEGLRRSFPDAEFGALCSPANADLFCRQRVHVHVIRDGEPEEPVVADVRSRHYTDAVVATEEPAGYRLARASGARRRAGFWHRFEKTFKSIWQYAQLTERVYRSAAWVAQPEHEVSAIYRLAEPLGAEKPIPDDPVRLRKWLDVDDSTSPVGKHAFAFQIAAKLRANDWNAPSVAAAALAALRGSH